VEYDFSHTRMPAEENAVGETLSELLLSTHFRRSKNYSDKLERDTLNTVVNRIVTQ
jgi:hypothetical protein